LTIFFGRFTSCITLLCHASEPNVALICAVCWRESRCDVMNQREHDAHLVNWPTAMTLKRKNIKSHNNCTPARTLLSTRSQNSGQKSQWDSLRFVYTEKPIVDDGGRRRPASSILARMLEGRQFISTNLSKHTAHRHEHVSPFISPYVYGYKWQSGKRKSHGMQYTWWR
jgi:hypothetical protein